MRLANEEKLPTAEEFLKDRGLSEVISGGDLDEYLKLHLKKIRYEYTEYETICSAYSRGSASIAEVNAQYDRFIKLLE